MGGPFGVNFHFEFEVDPQDEKCQEFNAPYAGVDHPSTWSSDEQRRAGTIFAEGVAGWIADAHLRLLNKELVHEKCQYEFSISKVLAVTKDDVLEKFFGKKCYGVYGPTADDLKDGVEKCKIDLG